MKFPWFLICFALLACQRPELPVLGKIPEFRLQTQDQKSFSQEDMKGKVWVANFVFTSCGGACPMMTERMKRNVQASIVEMAEGQGDYPARIVSFSVDPERDSPQVLAGYAKDHGADLRYWTFLTGPLQDVTKTVVEGFRISMGKVPSAAPKTQEEKADEIWEIVHGEQFLLIDDQGRIRGYYSSEGNGLRKLLTDLRVLIKERAS